MDFINVEQSADVSSSVLTVNTTSSSSSRITTSIRSTGGEETFTPSKIETKSSIPCCTPSNDDENVCGVCLSPLPKLAVVTTKCKHQFHVKCLLEAKQRNCLCPNCRTSLTPLTEADRTELTGYAIDTSPIPVPISRRPPVPISRSVHVIPTDGSSISHAIVEAATRGRNAVRHVLSYYYHRIVIPQTCLSYLGLLEHSALMNLLTTTALIPEFLLYLLFGFVSIHYCRSKMLARQREQSILLSPQGSSRPEE